MGGILLFQCDPVPSIKQTDPLNFPSRCDPDSREGIGEEQQWELEEQQMRIGLQHDPLSLFPLLHELGFHIGLWRRTSNGSRANTDILRHLLLRRHSSSSVAKDKSCTDGVSCDDDTSTSCC